MAGSCRVRTNCKIWTTLPQPIKGFTHNLYISGTQKFANIFLLFFNDFHYMESQRIHQPNLNGWNDKSKSPNPNNFSWSQPNADQVWSNFSLLCCFQNQMQRSPLVLLSSVYHQRKCLNSDDQNGLLAMDERITMIIDFLWFISHLWVI